MSEQDLGIVDPFAEEDPLADKAREDDIDPIAENPREEDLDPIADKAREDDIDPNDEEDLLGDDALITDPFAEEDLLGDDALITDPFAEEDLLAESANVGSSSNIMHIRIQQRNGRKTLTTLQGLPRNINLKKLLKAFKKEFACNGTIVKDQKSGKVIQLQGDQRTKISDFLYEEGLPKNTVKVHGF